MNKAKRRGGARDETINNINYTRVQLARLYNRMDRQLGVHFGPAPAIREGRRRRKRLPDGYPLPR